MRKICIQHSENYNPFTIIRDKDNKIIEQAKQYSATDFGKVYDNTLWYNVNILS